MTFFEKTFGFTERKEYSDNKNALFEMASFSVVTEADQWLHRPLPPPGADEEDGGVFTATSSSTRSNSLSFTPLGSGVDVLPDGEGDAIDGGGGALKRTLSSADDRSEARGHDVNHVVGERCVFAVKHGFNKDGDRIELEPVLWDAGIFSMPSVGELKARVQRLAASLTAYERKLLEQVARNTFSDDSVIRMENINGDSLSLHEEAENIGGVIQAASQFNMLEFPSPNCAPEDGITQYVFDRTQGPACAIACAPGTAYRNYLVPFDEKLSRFDPRTSNDKSCRGQERLRQLDGLNGFAKDLVGFDDDQDLGDSKHRLTEYFKVFNGYIESSEENLSKLRDILKDKDRAARLISKLRIGVQEDTQVAGERAGRINTKFTDSATGKVTWRNQPVDGLFPARVTQVYCSALSVGYSRVASKHWEAFARAVLLGSYEATLYVSQINTIKLLRQGKLSAPTATLPRTLLTKVGGGVFANDALWIKSAMLHATIAALPFQIPLLLRVVHYGKLVEGEYANLPKSLHSHPKVAPFNTWPEVSKADGRQGGDTSEPLVIAGEEDL
jgi:hypothetical protein